MKKKPQPRQRHSANKIIAENNSEVEVGGALLQGQLRGAAEEIIAQVIYAAQGGDMRAIKIVFDRIMPKKREAPISIQLPKITSIIEAEEAMTQVMSGAVKGEISLSEAETLSKLIRNHVDILEISSIERRVKTLEHDFHEDQQKRISEQNRETGKNGGGERG